MKKQRRLSPNLRLSTLQPTLQKLLSTLQADDVEDAAALRKLDEITEGLRSEQVLPVLISVAGETSPATQVRLATLLPEWLDARDHRAALLSLLEQRRLTERGEEVVEQWLQAAGEAAETLDAAREAPDLFFRAYAQTDEFGSQGIIILLWYTDARRRRATGMNLLIDYNPPWEGAVKDFLLMPKLAPDALVRDQVDTWIQRGLPLREIGAAEVKQEILRALAHNRAEKIRLPMSLILGRRTFLEQLLRLPDTPETPDFTSEDFNALAQTGRLVESIRAYEQSVGRRVRLDDGQEIFFIADSPDGGQDLADD